MITSPRLTILIHLYYEDSYDHLKDYFLNLKKACSTFLFSISSNPKNKAIVARIKKDFPGCIIIRTPNVGKDIGGKFALINLSIQLGIISDYYILLHDKQSPHTTLGETWRKKLFRIVEAEKTEIILKMFEEDRTAGIIASKEFIKNEYDKNSGRFDCTSNIILKELIAAYALNLKTHDFVGGTMFWVKGEIVDSFFKKYDPMEIRTTLEKGNILDHERGSTTHAWERMLSWIAIDQGYTIKGI